jgi:acetyl-CoA acyltransferase
MNSAIIASYVRSPFTMANKGGLAKVRPDDLAAAVVKRLVEKTGVPDNSIEDLILGCAFPEAEQGLNLARNVVFLSGLPNGVAGTTVNRFCGSSMQAIHMAVGAIAAGAGEAFICGGVESMTRIPMPGFNPMLNPQLVNDGHAAYMGMGETAENLAAKYNIDKKEQNAFAVMSHQKAAQAQGSGKLLDEIISIQTRNGLIDKDDCIRADTTPDILEGLKPAFKKLGSVTAGTSSPLTDGAAAVLVTSEKYAEENHLQPLARVKAISVAGCAPEIMGIGPVSATRKALERANLDISEMDIIELNEAFAAQSLAVIHDLSLASSKINIDGGAIALGHPLGATGARITGKAAQLLHREKKKYALATQCIGGGQGIATILEAL